MYIFCNKGLHHGQLGDDESLSGRRQHDGLHGSDSSTMVGVAMMTMTTVGTAMAVSEKCPRRETIRI